MYVTCRNLTNRGSALSLIIKSKWLAKTCKNVQNLRKILKPYKFFQHDLNPYRLLFSGFTLMVTLLLRANASFSTLPCKSLCGSEFVVSLLD